MKLFLFFVSCLMLSCTAILYGKTEDSASQIQWKTNYDQALSEAKANSKPIVLFFTGSDWCGWCSRLEEEALNTSDFAKEAGDKFIFVKLDYPLYTKIDMQLASQNKDLRKRFDVRSFPTIIVLDPNGKQLGSSGYRPGGGKEYANFLLKMTNDYSHYQSRLSELGKSQLSDLELQKLHEKAKSLQRDQEAVAILQQGLQSSQNPYFLREKYRALAQEGLMKSKEAEDIKKLLLARDPRNENHTHYELAVIEFERYCADMEKEQLSPEGVVAPLVHYIEQFGHQDTDNVWRLQMLISQVYLDSNKLDDALQYAQESFKSAPVSVKPEIGLAIDNIQAQLKHNTTG